MPKPRHYNYARARATLRCADASGARSALRALIDASGKLEALGRREPSIKLNSARVAGMLAARRAEELMPETKYAELHATEIDFKWQGEELCVDAVCEGFSRGGLGSRALLAVSVCAATIVDQLPEHAEQIVVDEARIVAQKGGLAQLSYHFEPPVRAGVLVTSDAVIGGDKEDRAGQIVREVVKGLAPQFVELSETALIGNDADEIDKIISRWVADQVELIVTVGGTGLVPTDVTVDVVEAMLERPIPGIMEAARTFGQTMTPVAFMSRGVAGLIANTLVITVPGSRGGARESCQAFFPLLCM